MDCAQPERDEPFSSPPPDAELEVLGAKISVPLADCWLRAFQTLTERDSRFFFHSGFYCWNNRCKKCFFTLRSADGEVRSVQACQTSPAKGDAILELPKDTSFSV